MFGKLKDKLKNWVKKVSEVEEEVIPTEVLEKPKKEKKPSKKPKKEIQLGQVSKKNIEEIPKKPIKKIPPLGGRKDSEIHEEEQSKKPIKKISPLGGREDAEIHEGEGGGEIQKPKEKKSFFGKIISKTKTISEEEFSEYSEDLEMILLENNVALKVSEKIINELKEKIVGKEINKKEIEELIKNSLKEIIQNVLIEPFDIIKEIQNKKEPYVMIFCGINGVGKTTTIAKFANMLKENKISSVMAAGDTFRAAAVEQIKEHGKKLDIKVVAHDYGSDPASVGFDAKKYAEKNNIKVVLIDTAGRIHTAKNLLQEMEKIKRVCAPDRTIFLGESTTGNDAVDQVKAFNETIGIDGIILSKADIDEKGGTALSVGYVTKKPILYLGTGQEYKDLEKFDKKKFIEKLGL